MAREYGRTDVKAMRNDKTRYARMEGEYVFVDGKNFLRFLPPKEDGPFYFKYFTHRLPGGDFHVCPKMTWKKTCPVCALGDNLFRSRDVDEINQGRQLYRKPAYLANVIDVRNPDQGVQIVRFGVQVRDQVADFFPDPDDDQDDGIDITDPEKGATVRITKVPPATKGDFPKYLASIGKQGPIPFKNWFKKLFDLEDVIKKISKTPEELRVLLTEAMSFEDAPGTETSQSRKRSKEDAETEDDDPSPKRTGKQTAPENEDPEPEDSDELPPRKSGKDAPRSTRRFVEEEDE